MKKKDDARRSRLYLPWIHCGGCGVSCLGALPEKLMDNRANRVYAAHIGR